MISDERVAFCVQHGYDRVGPHHDGSNPEFGFACDCSWSSRIHGNTCPEHGHEGIKVRQRVYILTEQDYDHYVIIGTYLDYKQAMSEASELVAKLGKDPNKFERHPMGIIWAFDHSAPLREESNIVLDIQEVGRKDYQFDHIVKSRLEYREYLKANYDENGDPKGKLKEELEEHRKQSRFMNFPEED